MVSLQVVSHQLLLFPDMRVHNWHPSPQGHGVRDKRTGRQWIESVIAYCEWRAGEPWRRLLDREQRFDPERWNYLKAAHLVHDAFYRAEEPKGLYIALPILNPAPSPLPSELELASLPRNVLIAALLRENPQYTDAKRLRFTKRKLARMLAQTRLDAKKAQPERMRA